jgi:fumarate hydratase subunit alpha
LRQVDYQEIVETVAQMAVAANIKLPLDVEQAINQAAQKESNDLGRYVLKQICLNQAIAEKEEMPLCQDTGSAVVFVELGQETQIQGGLLEDAINEGVEKGYREGYLRKSMTHPWLRQNTGDNTPAIIHLRLVAGDCCRLTIVPKGGGAENMSALAMLPPSAGLPGIKDFVRQTVIKAGPNPCPPLVIGVGVGGNFEKAPLLAKTALIRPLGQPSPDPEVAALEQELLAEINQLNIGPQGFGGQTTALAVHIEIFPCHIASLPVAVNLNCHVSRHVTFEL